MQTKHLVALVGLLALPTMFTSRLAAAPLGTAFTYQGRLNDGGQPANGSFDLKFTLCDAASGGTPVGGPITKSPMAVTNGLFSVTLDFGAEFDGSARWLEIAVRSSGSPADFTLLTPRQPLTPTPYALFAPSAGMAASATIASSVVPGSVGATGLAVGAVNHLDAPDGWPTNALMVNAAGLVGVGNSAPQAGLHITTGAGILAPHVLFQVQDGAGRYTNLARAIDVAVSGNLLAVSGRDDNAVTLLDISVPSSPVIRTQIVNGAGLFTNLTGAAELAFSGHLLAVAGEADDAVTLMDVSSPASPVRRALLRDGVGGFSELGGPRGLAISSNLLAIAAFHDSAVTLVDISAPASPVLRSVLKEGYGYTSLHGATDVALSGTLLAVAGYFDSAVTLVDVSNPATPVLLASLRDGEGGFTELSNTVGVAFSGNLLAIAAREDNAVTLVDVSAPASPVLRAVLKDGVGPWTCLAGARGVAFSGHWLAITGSDGDGVTLVDTSDPAHPVLKCLFQQGVAGVAYLDQPFGIAFAGTNLAVAGFGSFSLSILQAATAKAGLLSGEWVGIGTVLPAAPLHVVGNVIVEQADSITLRSVDVALGLSTVASGYGSTAMGHRTTASGTASTASGYGSTASGNGSTAIGNETTASAESSTAMGWHTVASGNYSTAMGCGTEASGHTATALGYSSTAAGDYALAAGRYAKANHHGTFVWADSQGTDFSSTARDQFLVRAANGVGLGATNPVAQLDVRGCASLGHAFAPSVRVASNVLNLQIGLNSNGSANGISFNESTTFGMKLGYNGVGTSTANRLAIYSDTDAELFTFENGGYLGVGTNNPAYPIHLASGAHVSTGGVWTDGSDRGSKENFRPVDAPRILELVQRLPITTWNFKVEPDSVRHIGPVAQDFHAAFGAGADDRHIAALDGNGVALAAIQGLNQKVEARSQESKVRTQKLEDKLHQKDAEITELKKQLSELKRSLSRLSATLDGGGQ
jgi:hypothetical protein